MSARLTIQKLVDHVTLIGSRYDDAIKDDPTVIDNRLNDIDEKTNKRLSPGQRGPINDFPQFLKKVFEVYKDTVFRIGVLGTDNSKELSLLTSVLTTTMPTFATLPVNEQLKLIDALNGKLLRSADVAVERYKEFGWKKVMVLKAIQEYRNNKLIIQMLSDLFHINLFIVDTKNDRLLAVYSEESFNMYKMNAFITYNGEFFEPLNHNDTMLWSYETAPFIKIIKVDKKSIGTLQIDLENDDNVKPFKIEDENLQPYLPEEHKAQQMGLLDDTLMRSTGSDDEEISETATVPVPVIQPTVATVAAIQITKQTKPSKLPKSTKAKQTKNGYEEISDGGNQSTDLDTEICETVTVMKAVDEIFVKPKKTDKTDKTEKNDKKVEIDRIVNLVKATDITKLTIVDLQNYAKQLGINTIDSYFKNGNPKLKTKNILYADIISLNGNP